MANKTNSRKLIIGLSVLVVILIIISIVGKKQGWIGKGNATEVEFGEASKKEIVEKVSASGKVQPEVELKISPDVSGEITELNIQEGDSVKKGDLLIRIREDIYVNQLDQAKANSNNSRANLAQMKANLARAEARYQLSRFNFERNEKLHKDKAISDADYEQAETDFNVARQELEAQKQNVKAAEYGLQTAKAAVRVAEDNLSFTKIYAPEGGIISKLAVEQGERVVGTSQMQGTEMLRIANLINMEVRVDVNENDIIRVSLGDTAEIEVDSYASRGEKFMGVVTAIANSPNDESFTTESITEFEVKVKILNESYKHLIKEDLKYPFKPGMTASVDIITDRKRGVLSVPLAAVTTRSGTAREKQADAGTEEGRRRGRRGNSDGDGENKVEKEEDEIKEVVFVYNKETETVSLAEVETGISDFDNIEITKGLEEGQQVITGPYLAVSKRLKDGDEVTKKEEGEKKGRRGRRSSED